MTKMHAQLYMAPNAKLAEKREKTLVEATVRVPGYQGSWFQCHQLTLMRIPSHYQALDELAVHMRRPPGYIATCCHQPALAIGYVAPQ